MNNLNVIQEFSIWVLPVLFAITLHEVAHGWVALKFGDKTALMLGRLTLNPLKHIDLIGTVLVPTILFFVTGFIFGWAKPVPVTWENLKNPKRDMAWVALAGPAANLLMALFWAIIGKVGLLLQPSLGVGALGLYYMGEAGIMINMILLVLNLLPIPPLDGSKIVMSLLPRKALWHYSRLEPFGIFILLGLLISGLLGKMISPIIYGLVGLFTMVFGL